MSWHQTLSRKKAVVFTTVTPSAYQDQLNAGVSEVSSSLKYIREFHTPVCYDGNISTNVTLSEMNCDWLFDMSALTNESCRLFQTFSRYARLSESKLNSTLTADVRYASDYGLLYNSITTVAHFMTALAISNCHRIHEKSPGRGTRSSADSTHVWRVNALNCPADGAASSAFSGPFHSLCFRKQSTYSPFIYVLA